MVRAECEASGSPRPPEFEYFDQYPLTDNDAEKYQQALDAGRVEQDIPVNHSEFFAPVIEPTLSAGTQALVVAALTYLAK
jgi:hippurate hydrolase